jgi:DNA-binding SARP family transcriptional activator
MGEELLMIEKDAPSVQIRVRLFGACAVEYRDEDGTWKTVMPHEWGGTTHSRRLLSFLLLHGRSAGRGTLMEQLWPGSDSSALEGSLNKAVSNVRKVFRAEWLLTINSKRTIYQLADQSQVWADVDAYEAALQQVEQCAPDSLERSHLLEVAQAYFEQGPLLDGEADLWCHARRERFGTAYYRCLLWLVEAYEAQGNFREAEAQIEKLLQRNPLDETALLRLMQLLQQQGLATEAIRRYKSAVSLFKKQGISPSSDIEIFAHHLQQFPQYLKESKSVNLPSAASGDVQAKLVMQEQLTPFYPLNKRAGAANELSSVAGSNPSSFSFLLSTQIISPSETLERLSHVLAKPAQLDDAVLLALEKLAGDCWRFRPDILGMLSPDLLQFVLRHLQQVTVLLSGSLLTSTRIRLCAIASELTQIAGWTLYEMQAFAQAQAYYEMALVAAREAENPLLEAIALARMSRIFKYCAKKEAILPALQYARRLLKNQSDSPIYSWLCAEEALAYARSKRSYESFKTLEQVTQIFQPNDLDGDPYWVGFEANVKAGFFGSCYTALQQFEQAEVSYREALAQISPASRINPKHRRSLLSVNLATILLRQEAVEEACKLGQDALVLISQSKSPLVLQHIVKFQRQLEPWKTSTAVETFNVNFMQTQTSLLKG